MWAGYTVGIHFLCIRGSEHGQSGHYQGQARFLGGHRLLLRRQEEFAHHDRQAGQEEIRPGRAQARRIPRVEDQVKRGTLLTSTGPSWPRFYFGKSILRRVAKPSPPKAVASAESAR